MRRKIASGIMLTLLLIGMLTLAFNIQQAKASGTIYIRADGSIDPPTANITSVDNVTYIFTDNINDQIVVERDNIVVDGAGYTLQGTGSGRGIDLTGRSNVTIRYIEIESCGIWLGYGSSYNTISGNTITNNGHGIALYYSSNYNTISGNTITNNWYGISLYESSRNTISGNKITNNSQGIMIAHFSNYNTISGNTITNNGRGIHLEYPYYSSNNKINHNNLMDNTHQVVTHDGYMNIWDDGYPSGGNCWSNYTGVDVRSGPYQNETGSDGIGDTPYVIDANNRDNYPLMTPLGDVEPPVAEAGPDLTVGFGTTVTFDGSKSIDDVAIKSYVWTFTDITPQTLTGIQPEYTFNNVGDCEVTLNVSDYVGNWNTDTITITVLPECTLIIVCSPTEVTFTVDGVSRTTPWSGTYSENTSVALIMPEIHTVDDTRYYWNQWSDGNTSRSRTVTMNTSITLTAHYESGPVYVRADGSVDPRTAPISSVDNVTYIFTDNINDQIVVERDNIVINGNGYTLEGRASGSGFRLDYMKNNLTIQNVNIRNFTYGIYIYSSSHNTISGNKITNNANGIALYYSSNYNIISGNNITANNSEGILLSGSSNNTLTGNHITDNDFGIYVYESSNNTLFGNNITANDNDGVYLYDSQNNTISGNDIAANNEDGIHLDGSSNNKFRNNDLNHNKYNFGVYGYLPSHYIQDIDDSNTVNGKPVYYWVNRRDITVPLDAGYVALINCTRITVQNLSLTNNGQGVLLAYTTNSAITKSNITDNDSGIYLCRSSNNIISGNNITNGEYGSSLYSSSSNAISGNTITENNEDGIYLYDSSNSSISGNTITNNSEYGIRLSGSSNSSISGNTITKNDYCGVHLSGSSSSSISGNTITNNFVGIFLSWSSNYSSISGNTITNNGWAGIDLYSNHNRVSGNTITKNGDYGIYVHHHAWMSNIIYHNNFINNAVQAWLHDQCNITLDDGYPSGGNYWSDYTGVDVKSGPYQNETGSDGIGDTPYVIGENNQDNYPLIHPYYCPDLNDDGIVDIFDLRICAKAFGCKPGDMNWNPIVDLKPDGLIDVFDLRKAAKHYLETV